MSTNQPIWKTDPWLEPYKETIDGRAEAAEDKEKELLTTSKDLYDFANGHHFFGLHLTKDGWVFREWAPNATAIFLIGDFNNWTESHDYKLERQDHGIWEIELNKNQIHHEDKYKLSIHWDGGNGERIPAYANRVVQDEQTKVFSAQVWEPKHKYQWKNDPEETLTESPLIYEAHVGMATEKEDVGSFEEFRTEILPRIQKAGYNVIQLMAIQEHPYYGSFGYHVSNFFAVSSRFGTPEEFKKLVDEAHGMGIRIIIDLIHSHSVKNVNEGLNLFDGTPYQYFHEGDRREHPAWDSLCFNYGKNEVIHFLLSNIKYWMEEYHLDGFRFDGVTSMLYYDHGLERAFDHYDKYFDGSQDEDAINYLKMANKLIHEIQGDALSVAEDMSGYPGLAAPVKAGGMGFDCRLAMGVPDYWIKTIKEQNDEDWSVGNIFWELTNKRPEEKTVSYAESHDQALVGDKTIIFRLIDKEMYWHMDKASQSIVVDRGIALHKMIRLITIATSGGGYLNFMGNEFGHPEWIDFPREGNSWSYKYARRQWSLVDNDELRYQELDKFDKAMIELIRENFRLDESHPESYYEHEEDQILVFNREGFVFVFNFNPDESFEDYKIPAEAGSYEIILNSDAKEYGGFNRVDESMDYETIKDGMTNQLMLYIPNRTAMVMRKKE